MILQHCTLFTRFHVCVRACAGSQLFLSVGDFALLVRHRHCLGAARVKLGTTRARTCINVRWVKEKEAEKSSS